MRNGVEAEASWGLFHDCRLQASVAYHNAEFGDYLADFDGTLQQLDGNRIEMSANELASVGFLYLPAQGFNASAIGQYVGGNIPGKPRRYLLNAGGRPKLFEVVAATVADDYAAFELSKSSTPAPIPT